MIDNVEGINARSDLRTLFFFGRGEKEVFRPAEVETYQTGSFQAVSMNTGRTIDRQTIVIVVPASGQAVGTSGFCLERHAENEQPARFECAEEIKTVALVLGGACTLRVNRPGLACYLGLFTFIRYRRRSRKVSPKISAYERTATWLTATTSTA